MATTTATQEQQVVVFDLAGERYGVNIHSVREIIRYQSVTAIPNAPASVSGIINLRGAVVPVVDLRRRLGAPLRPLGEETRIVVVETDGTLVGLIVDAVAEVLRLAASAIEPPPPAIRNAANAYVCGIARVGQTLTILLDLDGALSAEALARFSDEVRARGGAHAAATAPASAPSAAPAAPTLADLDIDLLEATFDAVKPRATELVEYFYEQLFAQYPAVVPLFQRADMQEQRGKLLSAIALVVASLRQPDALVPALQALGERHAGYGAQPAHYPAVGGVLLQALAYIAGDAWTAEAARAWADAYTVVANVMMEAAAASEARPTARAA